ncbi:MAG: hypothetical protein H6Q86_5797 [candidate division NC10 bacterium]|nr:hypothetical protein [candidate division NC10 bacterium]
MSRQSFRLMTLMGTVLVVYAFAPAPATAQEGNSLLQIGTTMTYDGLEIPEGTCPGPYKHYDQYIKVAGQVIIPEMQANVYRLIEMWGRDTETVIARTSANRGTFLYLRGAEYQYFFNGPVGTSWEWIEPETGNTMTYVVTADGLTRTLPTGVVYDNLTRVDTYCTIGCGGNPSEAIEVFFMSPGLAFPVFVWVANDSCPQFPRLEWLVSVTRK